jgi:hypothetical protein
MLDFPNTPAIGDLFPSPSIPGIPVWRWDGVKWTAASGDFIPEAPSDGNLYARRDGQWITLNIPEIPEDVSILPVGGQLRVNNGASQSSQLQYIPFNGDWIRIAGEYYPIPPSGILDDYQNVYVNGVPGQTLAVSTVYNVFLFSNNGVLTFDYGGTRAMSTTPGNVGTQIRTGDDSRTLIGKIYTAAAPNVFENRSHRRFVVSWLNRQPITIGITGQGHYWVTGAWVESAVTHVIAFAGQTFFASAEQQFFPNAAGAVGTAAHIELWLNSVTVTGRSLGIAVQTTLFISTAGSAPLVEGLNRISCATATLGDGQAYTGMTGVLL